MVKRILGIFHKEISGLHQAAYLLGFFALCSQVLALLRDRILAAHFGASNTLDIYYAASSVLVQEQDLDRGTESDSHQPGRSLLH